MKTALTILAVFVGFNAFAGNGEVGSADDGVFSRTTTLHEAYNPQSEAMRMSDLCRAVTAGTMNIGTCRIKCQQVNENVFSMQVAVKNGSPVAIEFQENDKTLMTFWGSDREHEYLNSKEIYMSAWIYRIETPAQLQMTLRDSKRLLVSCGVNTPM